jgi:hypothetical protein
MPHFAIIGWAATALLQSPVPPSANLEDFVLTDSKAYLILPPSPVGPGQTDAMQWSPSGRYLFLVQASPRVTPGLLSSALRGERPGPSQRPLLAWDRTTGRTIELGTMPHSYRSLDFQFFAGGDLAVLATDTVVPIDPDNSKYKYTSEALVLDPSNGRVRRQVLTQNEPGKLLRTLVESSPGVPRLVVAATDIPEPSGGVIKPPEGYRSRVWTVDTQGRATLPLNLGHVVVRDIVWESEGKIAAIRAVRLEGPETQRGFSVYLDVASGKFVPQPPPAPKREAPIEPLSIVMKAASSETAGFRAAWIKSATASEQPETLAAGQAEEALLSPDGGAAAIRNRGLVMVRLLSPIPKEAYLQAKAAAERMKTMAYGKQVALGLLMFAGDNKDRLPSAEEYGRGALGKYLKDQGLGGGFVYMMNGGFLTEMDKPAETVVGYVPGGGGYAWVFADGHVQWKPEAPKPPSNPFQG